MADDAKVKAFSPHSKTRNTNYRKQEGARRISLKNLHDELNDAVVSARSAHYIGCLLYLTVNQKAPLSSKELREALSDIEEKLGLFCRPGDALAPLASPRLGWAIVVQQLAVRDEALLICERLESLSIKGVLEINVGLSLFPVQSIRPAILWTKARRNLLSGVKRPKVRRSLACDTLRITLDSSTESIS